MNKEKIQDKEIIQMETTETGKQKETIIVNKKMVSQNPNMKSAIKETFRKYEGESSWSLSSIIKKDRSVIKNKLGKFVIDVTGPCETKQYTFFDADINAENLIEICKKTGLTGMSGNGFPVFRKLDTFLKANVKYKTIIVNAVECEPGLVHDQWLLENYFEEVIKSAGWLARTIGIKQVIIAAKKFPDVQMNLPEEVVTVQVPARYPMGEERILIKQLTSNGLNKEPDKELNEGDIPAARGILVMNIQTLLQVNMAAAGKQIGGRYVTLADLDEARAYAKFVNEGEEICQLLKNTFGERKYYLKGNGVMGAADAVRGERMEMSTSFLAVSSEVAQSDVTNRCKGCGRCTKVCPMGIKVKKIIGEAERGKEIDPAALGIDKCIGCRGCSYVCPACKNPQEIIGGMK